MDDSEYGNGCDYDGTRILCKTCGRNHVTVVNSFLQSLRAQSTCAAVACHPTNEQKVLQHKQFIARSCRKAIRISMQATGGIAYAPVFPVEGIYRDIHLL